MNLAVPTEPAYKPLELPKTYAEARLLAYTGESCISCGQLTVTERLNRHNERVLDCRHCGNTWVFSDSPKGTG